MKATPAPTLSTCAVPISSRITEPTPAEIVQARKAASLTQHEAAQLVTPATTSPYRVWQGYEAPAGSKAHRKIALATWELFLLMTNQHPEFQLKHRTNPGA